MNEKKDVLIHWLAGSSQKAIAQKTGRDRKTIRRYILAAQKVGLNQHDDFSNLSEENLMKISAELGAGPGRPLGEGWKLCEQHREVIATFIVENQDRLTVLHDFLRKRGAFVSYATLRRFISSEFGFARGFLTYRVGTCGPGEELQLDFGRMGKLEPIDLWKRRPFNAFIFTSFHTRHQFVYPTIEEETADAIAACEAAWKFFGGIFRVLVPSDTTSIMQLPVWPKPIIHPAFLAYSKKRKFSIDPTRTYYSKDNSRIDRIAETVRTECFHGEKFVSMEDARRHAREWCSIIYGMRPNKRSNRLPLEYFLSEEKRHLRKLPKDLSDLQKGKRRRKVIDA